MDDNGNMDTKVIGDKLAPVLGDEAESAIKLCMAKYDENKENIPLHLYKCYREMFPRRNKDD